MLVLALSLFFGLAWWWNRSARKWLEETGRLEWVPSRLDRLASGPREKPKLTPLRYSEPGFQEMVSRVLDEVPEEFDTEWENVAVIVNTEWPTEVYKRRMSVPEGHLIFGTYSGHAWTKGLRVANNATHIVVVYQRALELLCGDNKEQLEHEIRKVVLHELAHHLGMSHQRMKKIGL